MGNDSLQGCEFWTVVIPKGRSEKNTIRIGVVGFGKVGRACAELLLASKDVALAAIVRRLDSLAQPLPEGFSKIPVVSHTAQVHQMDAALLCVPIEQVRAAAHDCLQHGLPIIECALLHGEAFQAHREAIDRFATRFDVPAIVGAGWDPGALSLMRSLFGLLAPEGESEMRHRVAASLHHTAMARRVAGVKDALCTEQSAANGMSMSSWRRGSMWIAWPLRFAPIRSSSEKRRWYFRSTVWPRSNRKGAGSRLSGGVRRGARGISGFSLKPASTKLFSRRT